MDILPTNLKKLSQIAKEIGITTVTLKSYISKGYIDPKLEIRPKLWDVKQVKEQALAARIEIHKKGFGDSQPKPYDALTDDLKKWVDDYIDHRSSGLPIVFEGVRYIDGFGKSNRAEDVKKVLSMLLLKILRGRSGFTFNRKISKEDMTFINQHSFDIKDFNASDVQFLRKNISPVTFHNHTTYLRPFLYYVLMKLKEEYTVYRRKRDLERWMDYEDIKESFEIVLNTYFPMKVPDSKDQKTKVFLTRKQILQIFTTLFGDVGINMHDPAKTLAGQFMTGCFLGMRTEELSELRIEHFDLDPDGYIKPNEKGYGVLKFPAKASKGGYGPSHPTLGTLVVPNLLWYLNFFILDPTYRAYPETRGKGYLFRPLISDPETKYQNMRYLLSQTFSTVREFFDFLPEEKREAFKYYDTRHSINELIVTTPLVDPDLVRDQERAAQIQMRHSIEHRSGSVGNKHYRSEITAEVYFKIIDRALNFPWDLKSLELWEQEMRAGVPHDQAKYKGFNFLQRMASLRDKRLEALNVDKQELTPISPLQKGVLKGELEELQQQYEELKKKAPKGMSIKDRMAKLKEIEARIKEIEGAIQS